MARASRGCRSGEQDSFANSRWAGSAADKEATMAIRSNLADYQRFGTGLPPAPGAPGDGICGPISAWAWEAELVSKSISVSAAERATALASIPGSEWASAQE